jgi:hypothetical protein
VNNLIVRLMNEAKRIKLAAIRAYFLKYSTNLFNLFWSGVSEVVSKSRVGLLLYSPTTQTRALPEPFNMIDPE